MMISNDICTQRHRENISLKLTTSKMQEHYARGKDKDIAALLLLVISACVLLQERHDSSKLIILAGGHYACAGLFPLKNSAICHA